MNTIRTIFIKTVYFFPAFLVHSAICIISHSFTFHFYYHEENSFFKQSLSTGFYTCLIMTIINHLLLIFSDPGILEQSKCRKLNEQEMNEFKKQEKERSFNYSFCAKCEIVKPERSHHCYTCNRCVLRFEKHCIWVYNCIGINNLKYYYLFLLYSILSLSFAIIGFIYKVIHYELIPKEECNDEAFLLKSIKTFRILGYVINNEVLVILMQVYCNIRDVIYICIVIILSIFLFLPAFCEIETQTQLIMKNKTYVESLFLDEAQDTPNIFKDKLNNIKSVLGDSYYFWFLPIVEKNNHSHPLKPYIEMRKELRSYHVRAEKREDRDQILKKNE